MFILVDDIVWAIYDSFLQLAPYPSIVDVIYLASAPLFVAGLLLVGRGRIGRNGANLIDPLIVGVDTGMISWILLAEPALLAEPVLMALRPRSSSAYFRLPPCSCT